MLVTNLAECKMRMSKKGWEVFREHQKLHGNGDPNGRRYDEVVTLTKLEIGQYDYEQSDWPPVQPMAILLISKEGLDRIKAHFAEHSGKAYLFENGNDEVIMHCKALAEASESGVFSEEFSDELFAISERYGVDSKKVAMMEAEFIYFCADTQGD